MIILINKCDESLTGLIEETKNNIEEMVVSYIKDPIGKTAPTVAVLQSILIEHPEATGLTNVVIGTMVNLLEGQ